MADQGGDAPRVRVGVVDDSEDIRFLLRMTFLQDPRFELVGEATNGEEAIELAAARQPHLLLLDRHMPVMGGVEAIPEIRRLAPKTAVVLYTTGIDSGTAQAALAAGALEVLDKRLVATSLIDSLADILVSHWAGPDADVDIRIGPVPSDAACVWIENTSKILTAVKAHPDVLHDQVPADVVELFERFVATWRDVAESSDEFNWVARTRADEILRLVEYWALIDSMSDEQLEAIGCHWSPPEGEPFFRALTAGVLAAMAEHSETRELGNTLAVKWQPA